MMWSRVAKVGSVGDSSLLSSTLSSFSSSSLLLSSSRGKSSSSSSLPRCHPPSQPRPPSLVQSGLVVGPCLIILLFLLCLATLNPLATAYQQTHLESHVHSILGVPAPVSRTSRRVNLIPADSDPSWRPLRRQRRQFYFLNSNTSLGYGSATDSGPWGPWSDLSECTRSCGGGVNFQTRVCHDIPSACVGPAKRYFSCNVQECPPGTEEFRANQCARFNRIPFDGRYYHWTPYYKAANPCELNCKPEDERFYYRHARKVIDGTRCYDDDSNNICVDGICVELGCDRILGSRLKEDKCRVCGGDGSTCRTVEGVYDQVSGLRTGYNDILWIPAGSTNIRIEEVRATNNYFAVRNQHGRFYLNGKWRIQPAGTFEIAGTKFHYDRPHGTVNRANYPETLRALGPTSEALFIMLLYQEPNQGVSYEYSVPLSVQYVENGTGGAWPQVEHQRPVGNFPRYSWIFSDYSTCSRTCGTGVQRRQVYCASVESSSGRQDKVGDTLCDPAVRPPDTRPCSSAPCPATWHQGNWSQCSCVHKVQHRTVFCSAGDSEGEDGQVILPDTKCGSVPRPATVQPCKPDLETCPKWTTTSWSSCSVGGCGRGIRMRFVTCVIPGKLKPKKVEKVPELETTTQDVLTEAVEVEAQTTTSTPEALKEEVSTVMGTQSEPEDLIATTTEMKQLIQKREADYDKDNEVEKEDEYEPDTPVEEWWCDPATKPVANEYCSNKPCDEAGHVEWVISAWSSCDTDCGSSIQTRQVACVTRNGTVYPNEVCAKFKGKQPVDTQQCADSFTCSRSLWFTSEWSACNVECGVGWKTRHVFCGHLDEQNKVVHDEESKCSAELKPQNASSCNQEPCSGVWFTGPTGHCSLPCGGGSKEKPIFCFKEKSDGGLTITDSNCTELEPSKSEQCNMQACDEDQIATVVTCKDTEFGCCPTDDSTPAEADLSNCPQLLQNQTIKCADTQFGCCDLELTEFEPNENTTEVALALGPWGLGCPIRCEHTWFGCCPDLVTPATSFDKKDCPEVKCDDCLTTTTTTEMPTTTTLLPVALGGVEPEVTEGSGDASTEENSVKECSKSRFGCCPDGWTEAGGPDGEGCDDGSGDTGGIITSTISSIWTVVTGLVGEQTTPPAELECNLTEFGCCPNGKTKATGPRFTGCTCHDYPFGCCQDEFSPAAGLNFEGCICSRMLYGCCPDDKTPATGPEQQGCHCETSTHGCCPDMVTMALGPNYLGCPCDTLTYGCCPGSQVPARGPNFAGCTCAETPFGCCTDGVTVAYGPKFEGCPSGPSLDLKLASEVCALPMEVGPCRNFSVKWFFDVNYGGCNRFWYGGCQGNGNRFSSQELCERACVKPEGPERCLLPRISGPCNASAQAWYYDSIARRCDQFLYGGCLGNTNRFENREACEQTCIYQETALDMCEQPPSSGPCRGNYRRWFYRKDEGRCREFTYGGCQGNLNNFQTEHECQNACASTTPAEICSLPRAEGPCLGNFPRWHFDASSGVCREFTYTGCEGNRNRFVSREACERLCNQTIGEYHYPPRPSEQGGSEGEFVPYENVCALPKAVGPCRASIPQWYFDSATRSCQRFHFGGCGGNANRFDDRESCEQACGQYVVPQHDPCLETKESGNCFDYRERWYYDVEDRRCHRFYYSGCGGNRNNFYSLDECTTRCEEPRVAVVSSTPESTALVHPATQFPSEYCFKAYDSGHCHNTVTLIRWYYDRKDGACKEFIYGGCGGNENRFESQIECETKCFNSQDICKLPQARGSCTANFTQWYFNHEEQECQEFQFSGCHGNANRFSSKETCEAQCRPNQGMPVSSYYQVADQCRLERDQGPCRGYYLRWYFSVHENQCQIFIYGGCGGNANQFATREECEGTCHPRLEADHEAREGVDSPDVVCRLPMEKGPCQETQAGWFYDPDSHTCLPFVYGGCRGNKNRFPDYERCIRFCSGVSSQQYFPPPPPPYQPPDYPQYPPSSSTTEAPVQPQYPYPSLPPLLPPLRPEECEPMECGEDHCILGIDYYHDSRGCPACRCTNPCNDKQCPPDMSCALELYRDESTQGKVKANAECRLRNKPGTCPQDLRPPTPSADGKQTGCIDQCRTDADCRHADKCCHNGCANICVSPPDEETYYIEEDVNRRPSVQPDDRDLYNTDKPREEDSRPPVEGLPERPRLEEFYNETERPGEVRLTVQSGDDVTLECPILSSVHEVNQGESRSAQPVWSRDGQHIDGASERIVLLENGSLYIRQAVREDHGTYACMMPVAVGESPETRMSFIRLAVHEPARILPGPQRVIAQIGLSSYMHCNAIGFPDPKVTWWREDRMLPLNSLKYRQLQNFTLIIRNVASRDSGIYSCHAYNGIGPIALWDVTLLLDSDTTDPLPHYDPRLHPAPNVSYTYHELDQIYTEVQFFPQDYRVGSTLQLNCVVRSRLTGQPVSSASVVWYVAGSDIPLLIDHSNQHHYRVLHNNTLLVYHLAKADSGEYRCRASTGPQSDAVTSVNIQVENIFVPPDCQDSPFFANCEMIVRNNFCNNPHYAKFCCRSCYVAQHSWASKAR